MRARLEAEGRNVPIIGLTKNSHPNTEVYITATPDEVREVAQAGADVVAFDGTDLPRPFTVAELVRATHAAGAMAMADISTLEEAQAAYTAGADIVGTTMSGYTPHSPKQAGPDFALMDALRAEGLPFIAEGRLNTPELAAEALRRGAHAAVVGSAITRPDHVTRWFAEAVRGREGSREQVGRQPHPQDAQHGQARFVQQDRGRHEGGDVQRVDERHGDERGEPQV